MTLFLWNYDFFLIKIWLYSWLSIILFFFINFSVKVAFRKMGLVNRLPLKRPEKLSAVAPNVRMKDSAFLFGLWTGRKTEELQKREQFQLSFQITLQHQSHCYIYTKGLFKVSTLQLILDQSTCLKNCENNSSLWQRDDIEELDKVYFSRNHLLGRKK